MQRYLLLFALAGCIGIPGPAVGDDDDDAPPDVATCARSLGELLPSPAFDATRTSEKTPNVRDVVVADLDGDGLDDVIALLERNRVAVARTRSDGGFATPVEVAPFDFDLRSLATVDLDDDGDLDVVAAGSRVVTLRNDAGTLVEDNDQATGTSCYIDVLVPGQFDDDARPDVVAACTEVGEVVLLRHADGISLGAPVDIGTFSGLRGVAGGEIAGDTRDDLVVFGGGVELLRAIGGGSFATTHLTSDASPAAATGDLDADGRDDAIAWVGTQLVWLRGGDTPGALVPLPPADIRQPLWLEVGAIDDNPGEDLVLVEGDDLNPTLWRTLVIGSPLTDFAIELQPGTDHRRCRLGRLDASDEPDLACVQPYGPVMVPVIHRGALPAASRPLGFGAVLGQFDLDDPLEVLTTGAGIEILEPAGDRFVVEASNPDAGLAIEPIAAVDWTADGKMDLLVRGSGDDDGATVLLPGTGPATFGAPIELFDAAWIQLVVGDLDHDTYPDLAGWTLPFAADPELHVAFGGPGGTIGDTIERSGLRPIAIADVIAGGAPELIVGNGEGQLQIMDASDRTLSLVTHAGSGLYPLHAVASDLDGDGDTDLATLEVSGDKTYARTYIRGNNNTFASGSSYEMRGWVDDLAVADVDGDGAPDVLAGSLMLLLGQGDGLLAPPVPFARPTRLVGVVPAPAGAADQLIYIVSQSYGAGTLEMLAPGCR